MSLELGVVKVEDWECGIKPEPGVGPEQLPAPDVAGLRAGGSGISSAVGCSVKQECIAEEPSDKRPGLGTELTVRAKSYQDHEVMQGLKLEAEYVKEEEEEREFEEEFWYGLSDSAARAGLHTGHAVKRELVLEPEVLQTPKQAEGNPLSVSDEESVVRRSTGGAVRTYPAKRSRTSCDAGAPRAAEPRCSLMSEPQRGRSVTEASAPAEPMHVKEEEEQWCSAESRNASQALATEGVSGEGPQEDVCNKQFSRNDNSITPTRVHTGEKPYTCGICYKQFTHESTLYEHKRNHTGEKPYECDSCNRRFPNIFTLNTHKRIHTEEKPYECDICCKRFSRSDSIVSHKRIHTGEKPYECDICYKKFTQSSHLIAHKRIHTGEKPYECDICYKQFTQSSMLTSHKIIHTGEKPYECDICFKRFTRLNYINLHNRIHTGEKPYKCDICYKMFTYKHNLITHKRTHSKNTCDKRIHMGEKQKSYECNIWNKQFTDTTYLGKHKRIDRGVVIINYSL